MTIFVEIVYVFITVILILVVLLQAGRGGGMGTALGGGASQSVFGGSGGADFMAKLTQGLAAGFMICAVILAYFSAHSGSERLQAESEKSEAEERLVDDDEPVNYEAVGPNPLRLPAADVSPTDATPTPTEESDSADGLNDPDGAEPSDRTPDATPDAGHSADKPAVPGGAAAHAGDESEPAATPSPDRKVEQTKGDSQVDGPSDNAGPAPASE